VETKARVLQADRLQTCLVTTDSTSRSSLIFRATLGPQIQQQTFSDVGGFLSSMLGLTPTATAGVAEQLSQARAAEYGQMAQQAPLTRRFMEALSPEQAEMTRLAQEEAMRATRAAGGLTPEEAACGTAGGASGVRCSRDARVQRIGRSGGSRSRERAGREAC
jgi:uncharacterized protein YdbL (DUF1318 family)